MPRSSHYLTLPLQPYHCFLIYWDLKNLTLVETRTTSPPSNPLQAVVLGKVSLVLETFFVSFSFHILLLDLTYPSCPTHPLYHYIIELFLPTP